MGTSHPKPASPSSLPRWPQWPACDCGRTITSRSPSGEFCRPANEAARDDFSAIPAQNLGNLQRTSPAGSPLNATWAHRP